MEDLDREHPHFEGVVPVKIVRPPAPATTAPSYGTAAAATSPSTAVDARVADLTIRLLGGTQTRVRGMLIMGVTMARRKEAANFRFRNTPAHLQPNGHRQRVLHMEISDEADLQFLHTLSVGEAEFADLASEQAILVDFGAFPAKLIELLQQCAAARHDAATAGSASGSTTIPR